MKKWQYLLLAIATIAVFILVYSIHFDYPFPYHMDEWHHISSAMRLGSGQEYMEAVALRKVNRSIGLEIGFQIILLAISSIFNLVAIYQYLPAIWASLTALTMFFVVYSKSEKNFLIAFLAVIFFASIRSNVNVMGIWFFTPLTFALPLILLYFYFFSEGVEKIKPQYILAGLSVMLLLIPIHAISALFAIPTLLIYCILNRNKLRGQLWLFWLLLLLLMSGLIFFKYVLDIPWTLIMPKLFRYLTFDRSWIVFDAGLQLTDLYSLTGIILALIGCIFIITNGQWKRLSIFLVWLAAVGFALVEYLMFGVSYLSPFPRNLYYFVLVLPIFSAYGLYAILQSALIILHKLIPDIKLRDIVGDILGISIIAAISVSAFLNYYNLRPEIELYRAINQEEFKMLSYLSGFPRAVVMAQPLLSLAVYPVAHQDPIADLYFYGNRGDVDKFYAETTCDKGSAMIEKHHAQYIISPFEVNCAYTKLLLKDSVNWLYLVDWDYINSIKND